MFVQFFLNNCRLCGAAKVGHAEGLVRRERHELLVVMKLERALGCVFVAVHAGVALGSGVGSLRVSLAKKVQE